ncbi:adenine phosphoribosyltransferase [Flavobacterium psychrotrophum]|uniref:adenine phosphoribosyltransferase n=1 Tax=Flavobacterium psychrotrophum TaxID=2294119 RepID=UPI000E324139|nr:adenine phosphoribosyltransferase [Flavobacterium psychrotrophum]
MTLNQYIRDIQDFPKPGILFKDITPLLGNPAAVKECMALLLNNLRDQKIDKVIGAESRGFFFATLLAYELGAGFVPVRKPGKLPYSTFSASYELEYGTDTMEVHTDAIKPGERVVIHDDVLATGGTAKALCQLVEQLGGVIVQCNFLMELSFLNGREKLTPYPVYAPLVY